MAMTTTELSALNDRHGIKGELVFRKGPGGLTVAEITNAHGSATIALQGAQVLKWAPHAENPVIWLSPAAQFARRKSIRGGVPICWPWFGSRDEEDDLPNHGFARTAPWELVETEAAQCDATRLTFRLVENDQIQAHWPHQTRLEMTVTVGANLDMTLKTRNDGVEPVVIGKALHTYFEVSDVRQVRIHGLENCYYLDKVDGGALKRQRGTMVVSAETDRIYLDSTADCLIEDPGLGRCVRISKWGSRSTVVWNPWAEKSEKLNDLGDSDYLHMVCVETANAANDVVTIEPGGEHDLGVRYSIERLG
ncbi:MAG: aldose 1-epimerase [Proteobacteria bacterium]|nr:aldose 1-epimerase [Pseudomonadota bacterium]